MRTRSHGQALVELALVLLPTCLLMVALLMASMVLINRALVTTASICLCETYARHNIPPVSEVKIAYTINLPYAGTIRLTGKGTVYAKDYVTGNTVQATYDNGVLTIPSAQFSTKWGSVECWGQTSPVFGVSLNTPRIVLLKRYGE